MNNRAFLIMTAAVLSFALTACAPAPSLQRVQKTDMSSTQPTITALARASAAATLPASDLKWDGHFGSDRDEVQMSTLLGVGFFQAPTSRDIDELIDKWMKEHPDARVLPVSDYGPMFVDEPDSSLLWVWVVDGDDILNLDLVEAGAAEAATMNAPPEAKLLIDKKALVEFRDRLPSLERKAKDQRLGIWGEPDA